MEERLEEEPRKAGKKLGEENLLGAVLGGAGWMEVDGGLGLKTLAGHGGREDLRDVGRNSLALSSPLHSASFSSPVCHPQAVPP